MNRCGGCHPTTNLLRVCVSPPLKEHLNNCVMEAEAWGMMVRAVVQQRPAGVEERLDADHATPATLNAPHFNACSPIISVCAYAPEASNAGAPCVLVGERPSQCGDLTSQRRHVVAMVEFKGQHVEVFVLPHTVHAELGCYVIVPGDRGWACGLLIQTGTWNPTQSTVEAIQHVNSCPRTWPDVAGVGVLPVVHHVATPAEVERLTTHAVWMERLAVQTAQRLAHLLQLAIRVVDAEYQWDGAKIEILYDGLPDVPITELITELYRVFGTRIWMENVHSDMHEGEATSTPSMT